MANNANMGTTVDVIDRRLAHIAGLLRRARAEGKSVTTYMTTIDTLLEQRLAYSVHPAADEKV